MLRKFTFYLLALALLWPAAQRWSAAQAPAQPKQAKDAEEANLFNNILKENDPKKKLQLLDQWTQKYPDTAFKEQRYGFYIQAYQISGQLAKAVEAAQELLKLKSEELTPQGIYTAHFTIALLTPFLGSNDPNVWANGEKSANFLLQSADEHFSAQNKPQGVSDDQWAQAKKGTLATAHQSLGWVAKQQKKNDAAEQELIKAIELNPNNGQVSFWLGEAVLAEKNPDKYPLAFFGFARASSYDGPGALAPQVRQQIDAYLAKIYKNYHGDDSGLAELKAMAKTQPLPSADLKIKSSEEVKAEKEEELKKSNPLLAIFVQIKEGLTGAESAKFWEDMKGKAMPPLRGTIVSAKPAVKPKVVELAMSQSQTAEITLTAPETSARCKLDPGATVEFKDAEAKEFTPNPFMLKLEGGKITSGCSEAPAPVKKAPAKKASPGAAKKKAG